MVKDKAVTENTIVFNNLVNNVEEYNESWEVAPLIWHSRFFKQNSFMRKIGVKIVLFYGLLFQLLQVVLGLKSKALY
jgi:hypothetical protein